MKNKVVLITGAASGLGLATAERLAAAGADLSLVDVNQEGLTLAAEALRGQGVRVLTQCCDLSEAANCREAVTTTVAELGRLDGLCNVAAVMLPSRTTEMAGNAFDKTLAVNLAAPFYLMQAALPHLIESEGSIVNVASAVGITAQAYNAAYCASKAGLIHMTKSLAMEYMHDKVRINAVAPGGMMTPLARNMMSVTEPDPSLLGRASPLRGLVEMNEVAEMVAFLVSDQAQGYHGACIVIDKGMCAG